MILSSKFSPNKSGIVIAGYGKDEYFPQIIAYETDGTYAGRLKIRSATRSITVSNSVMLIPFAQTDTTRLFMEGVDPEYLKFLEDGVSSLIPGLAQIAAKHFGATNQKKILAFKTILEQETTSFLSLCKRRRTNDFIDPVIDAIDVLDKAEMAALAENLVNLTALKQKISLDLESVGGPVDVAFISKNDGFIWIKRKHYFEPNLNPFFFQRYLNR